MMNDDLIFDCPACGQNVAAPRALAGHTVSCPACGQSLRLPGDKEAGKQSTRRINVDAMGGIPPPPRPRRVVIKRQEEPPRP